MGLATFLRGAEQDQLRGLAWFSLVDVCQIGGVTSTSDSGGGASSSWAYGSDVPCRVDPIGGQGDEGQVGARINDSSTHSILLPAGTTVTTSSRVQVTGGKTYEVTAVRDTTAGPLLAVEAVQLS